jgi:sirohydrochlorin cobaltochelatase
MLKKGILVVNFGTTYKKQLENCIEAIENFIGTKFKYYDVRRAFTSNIIIKKLKKRIISILAQLKMLLRK